MLILNLGTEEWIREDYTSTTGSGISFTIYTEEKMVNVKNISGYTLKIKFIDQHNHMLYDEFDCDIVSATDGTGEFLPKIGELDMNYIGEIEVELTGTNEILSARGTNGSGRFRIR
jgi:hypothetical protein